MAKQKSHEQFVEEFIQKGNPNISLEGEYCTRSKKIPVYCKKCGVHFEMYPRSLLRGSGCRKCMPHPSKSNSQFIIELKAVAPTIEVMGEYITTHKHIQIKCTECGHIWSAMPSNLLRGYGCPICNGGIRKDPQIFHQQMQELHPDIEVLEDYIGTNHKIKFRCKRCGNVFSARPSQLIDRKGNCPACIRTQTSFLEQCILSMFVERFGKDFVLSRDRTIINYELDIVVLDQSKQPIWAIEPGSWSIHKSVKNANRDFAKRKACAKANIKLLTIYDCDRKFELTETDNIWAYSFSFGRNTEHEMIKLLYRIANYFCFDISDLNFDELLLEAHKNSRRMSTDDFKEQLAAINPNIEVTGEYRGSMNPIPVYCKICGYTWSPTPQMLTRMHTGCPQCHKVPRKNTASFISEMKLKGNPNVVVDGEYVNAKTKTDVHCTVCGNRWQATPDKLLRGQGCPECARKKRTKKVQS